MRKFLLILIILPVLAGLSVPASAQRFAVKANALNWVLCTPDIGFEFITGEHTSVALNTFGHWKPYGVDSKMITVQPEFRYWFSGRPLTRGFIGAAAFASFYDMSIKSHVYNGTAGCVGVTGGYVFSLAKKWGVEISGGFGFLFYKQKNYLAGDKYDGYYVNEPSEPNDWGYMMFPVKLGVTFIYIIN